MRIDRRLTFIGVMLIVLSMTMATQYATTKVGYTFGVVHPTDADIRFIGSDNASDMRVLREAGANGTTTTLKVSLGNWSANTNKTYTAAFGIVNEEAFKVNITHVDVTTTAGSDEMQIWLHGARANDAVNDGGVFMWNKGTRPVGGTASAKWILGAGDGDPTTIDGAAASTTWDGSANVRFSLLDTVATNNSDDYVWVQISVNLSGSITGGSNTGNIIFHFNATTHH